jgi:hypothetical protein
MFRKPAFWVAFVVLSAVCAVWAARHFAEAFPLVTLDITMDREEALEAAEELANSHGWGPDEARQAAAFRHDDAVQSFVELEAGGQQAYAAMLAGNLYSPYTWVVRGFREGETNESVVRFRPDGVPYGFREKLPEDEPGASLEPEAARELAEDRATVEWGVDLAAYELVEAAQEVRPGGRVDHTFVYERPDVQIGDGRYRLRLVVGGDRLTELTHFVKIPEAFSRRYQEMRSANDGIATAALFAVAILYLGGGCVVGLFFLLRERWVVWKPALKWAVFIAFLQALVVLNQWPLAWMGYDTAVPATTFALQQIGVALAQLVGMGALLALTFIAAESLTRRAFPGRIQLWRSWRGDTAASKSLLGYTTAGYLLIGVFFAYEVALYFLANRHLGWWSPSDALTDPNILANLVPWLTPLAISLQAGFWEECLFRAVPIATAALLGKRFGKRGLWIAGALVLQAVIFGAGHANYPAQPAYARLVELIIPALGFGGLYLVFGLVPAIVLHFAFDVVWFALPLFAAATPGIWVDRGLVIVLTLVPLWVVLRARWRAGAWGEVPEVDFNRSWFPPPPRTPGPPAPAKATAGLAPRTRIVLAGLGLAGLLAWGLTVPFVADAPPILTGDREARTVAREVMAERGDPLGPEWRELSSVDASPGLEDRFVWREGGKEAYLALLGAYLAEPRRVVRYARFEGDVAERAEEWRVFVGPDGSFQRTVHTVPEGRAGARLEETEARAIALSALEARYGLQADAVEEVSAEPAQLPERRDWTFVFRDPAGWPLNEGEARIEVDIAGDEITATGRFVYVPEDWERAERSRRSITQILQISCTVLLVLVFIAGGVLAVIRWSRHEFQTATFAIFFALSGALGAVALVNRFRPASAGFLTAQPFALQAAIVIVGGLIATTILAAVSALLIGLAHRMFPRQRQANRGEAILAGLALGTLLSGAGAVATALAPSTLPFWPSFAGAADFSPFVAAALGPLASWITGTALALFVVALLWSVTAGWHRLRGLASAVILVFGVVLVGSKNIESVPLWLLEGVLTGIVLWLVWVLVVRRQPALVPLVTAAGAALGAIRSAALGAYPGARAGSLVGAVLIVTLAIWWFSRLSADTDVEPAEALPANNGAEAPIGG